MDAISSSVTSTLKLSAPTNLHSTHHLKTPNLHTHQHNRSRRSSISRRNSFTHATSRSDPSLPRPSPSTSQKRASTGYAAALLDIAQCSGALPQVESDVRRFSRLLGKVLEHPEAEKGRVVKEAAAAGRFHRTLVALVNMLLEKKKKSVDLVAEVMEEFQRIYDQLAGTAVVLVSSPAKMERDEIFGIAQRVQIITGAAKVKVNNLVAPHQSSFAH